MKDLKTVNVFIKVGIQRKLQRMFSIKSVSILTTSCASPKIFIRNLSNVIIIKTRKVQSTNIELALNFIKRRFFNTVQNEVNYLSE